MTPLGRPDFMPHRSESFKVSNDPLFAEKLEAVVGIYLSPSKHAIVLCVDEKSQVQAMDRTQPNLPLKRGQAETMPHDYKMVRHHHVVSRPWTPRRAANQPMPAAASAPGMVEVSVPDRRNDSAGQVDPFNCR